MKRVDKPIRLYVLAIFIVLAYGVMPFVSTLPYSRGFVLFGLRNLALNGSIWVLYGPDGEAPLLLVVISLFLCVFTAASAIWAFTGDREGRTATLIFVSLNVLWWTLLVIMVLVNNDLPGTMILKLIFQVVPPFLWLGFIWWNFTRQDINDYYSYQARIQEQST
jgi:hypothetical protein